MKQEFMAVIKQHEGINGAYIEPPFDVEAVFNAKRVKVLATFDGVEYRGSIVRMGGIYMLGLTKEIRGKIGKNFGDTIQVTIVKDEEERSIELPEDFKKALADNPGADTNYNKLSFTGKKEYVTWITDAKKAETRKSRIEQAISKLKEGKKLR